MRNVMTAQSTQSVNPMVTGGLGILGGLWFIVSPFVLGYSSSEEGGKNATTLGITVGVLAIVATLLAVATERVPSLKNARLAVTVAMVALGLVAMVAPYLFNYAEMITPLWNLQITGGLFIIVAGYIAQALTKQIDQ